MMNWLRNEIRIFCKGIVISAPDPSPKHFSNLVNLN